MPEKANQKHNLEELIYWYVPEFDKHERVRNWYIAASIISIIMLIFAFYTANFLFAVIIIITAFILVLRDAQVPDMIKVSINYEGVNIGKNFYDYDILKDFSIVFKPKFEIKQLYFEFKNSIRPRLSVSLNDINPLIVREILLKYLPEDLERTDESTTETLAKFFRL